MFTQYLSRKMMPILLAVGGLAIGGNLLKQPKQENRMVSDQDYQTAIAGSLVDSAIESTRKLLQGDLTHSSAAENLPKQFKVALGRLERGAQNDQAERNKVCGACTFGPVPADHLLQLYSDQP